MLFFLVVPEKYFQNINVLGMFISKLFLLVFLMILMLLQKKQKNIPTHYLITYFAIPIACIFVLCVLYRKSMYIDYISYIATGCIMLLNIVSYYLLDELSDYIIRASKVFQLNNQLETQKEKYEQLSTAFRSGNRLLHDTNKHLRYIGAKLQSDDAQGAMDYIERISGTLQETYGSICTGNLAVDSILSNMKTRLQEMNIPCYLTVNIEEARMRDIPEYDLVTIIGNITDNQMKAVPLVTDRDKRYVLFELEMLDNTIRIFAKNGMPPQQPVKMPYEDWFHGVGLHNVRETLERHGGALVTEVQDDFFLTMGVLPLGEGRKAVYYKGIRYLYRTENKRGGMRMQIKIISCETLKEYMQRDDCILLDLREKADYEQGHLPGAVYADWETLEQNIDTILEQQEKEIRAIVLYCDRGNISLIVARDLVRKGYPAISVGGGFMRCGRTLAGLTI